MHRWGFWVKILESLNGENNAQNLICIAKMVVMVFESFDWLPPKNRLDVASSNSSIIVVFVVQTERKVLRLHSSCLADSTPSGRKALETA